jgi:hypothetical protein
MANMNDSPKGNGRLFIDIHLRQWTVGEHVVRLRDLAGNVVELDGLIHDRPHQFILVELDLPNGDNVATFDVPGYFTDYHPHNGHAIGAPARAYELPGGVHVPATNSVTRIAHPARKVERHPEHGLAWVHNGEPVHPQPLTADGKPAERGKDQPIVAAAPLGAHRDIVPPK